MKNDDVHSDYHCPRQASTGMSGNFMTALTGKSSRRSVPPAVLISVPLYSNTVGITALVATPAMIRFITCFIQSTIETVPSNRKSPGIICLDFAENGSTL